MRRQQSNNQVAQNLNKLQNCQAAIKKAHKGKTKAYEKDHDEKVKNLYLNIVLMNHRILTVQTLGKEFIMYSASTMANLMMAHNSQKM